MDVCRVALLEWKVCVTAMEIPIEGVILVAAVRRTCITLLPPPHRLN